MRLCKDIKDIKAEEKRELIKQEEEKEKRRVFEEGYSKRRNG